jgi:hypothetical protein
MGGACSTYGKMRNAYKIVVGKPKDMILLERPSHRWEYNIRLDFNGI